MPIHVVNESYEHYEERGKKALKRGLPVILFGLLCLIISFNSDTKYVISGVLFSAIVILIGLIIIRG